MRFAIFLLLGPPLGCLALLLVAMLVMALAGDAAFSRGSSMLSAWLALLVPSYVLGLVPAGLTALFDAWLAGRPVRRPWRVTGTAAFGFVVGFLPILAAIAYGFVSGPAVLLFGLCGLAAGAACSALTAAWEARRG